jgi:hypothetical protein
MMTFRFEPGTGLLIEELAGTLTNAEARRITKTEVVERALAVYHSLLVSGNITILEKPEVRGSYRRALAQTQGIKLEETPSG